MVMVQEWNFTWPLLSPGANKGAIIWYIFCKKFKNSSKEIDDIKKLIMLVTKIEPIICMY